MVRAKVKYYLKCAFCGELFHDKHGDRVSDSKRGKTHDTFCCREHGMWHRARARRGEKCKRCKKSRGELSTLNHPYVTGVAFNSGYCPRCYRLRQTYDNDEVLIQIHEIKQVLKKEAAHAARNPRSKPLPAKRKFAPFTRQEVINLNAYQAANLPGRFLCENGDSSVMRATATGWECPCCDYGREWCYAWMANGSMSLK